MFKIRAVLSSIHSVGSFGRSDSKTLYVSKLLRKYPISLFDLAESWQRVLINLKWCWNWMHPFEIDWNSWIRGKYSPDTFSSELNQAAECALTAHLFSIYVVIEKWIMALKKPAVLIYSLSSWTISKTFLMFRLRGKDEPIFSVLYCLSSLAYILSSYEKRGHYRPSARFIYFVRLYIDRSWSKSHLWS